MIMTVQENKLVEEINSQFVSVGKMVAHVQNKVAYLKEYGGHRGRDGGEVLEIALREIPQRFHSVYYKYAHQTYKP